MTGPKAIRNWTFPLIRKPNLLGDTSTEAGRSLLAEQYRALREKLPFMYLIMLGNSAALSLATYGTAPNWMSVGVPGVLCAFSLVRACIWLRRRNRVLPPALMRRHLMTTYFLAILFAVGYVGWGLLLFEDSSLVQRMCIGLFVFIAAISSAFCLQSFPAAGRVVLIVGALAVPVRMFIDGDWFLIGIGLNLTFVALLIDRIVRSNYAGFAEVLSSRNEMLAERERAREAERKAHDLAYRDPLTSLPNRRALSERLEDLVTRRDSDCCALMMVDLDRFKDVNDVHGHPVGDALLRRVAAKLKRVVGPSAEAFRLGGDEFAVLLDSGVSDVEKAAQRLVDELAAPVAGGNVVHHVGASIGIACFPIHAKDRQALMRKADIALYEAKTSGRGVYRMFRPAMDEVIRYRSSIEAQLRRDVRSSALTAYLQPIVDMTTRQPVGFELLARWRRDGRFFIAPDQFIPVADERGLINELMLKLLEQGCTHALADGPTKPIAINISPLQLRDPHLGEHILAVLDRCGYPTSLFGIEVTETGLVSDLDRARATIEGLKAHGVQIALDDFGTGYSSLAHLHMLPFDKIKIDRSFVTAIATDSGALTIVRAIVNLANSMGLCAVAEGVESEDVARSLQQMGCTQGQGFHFGRPQPADRLPYQAKRSAA